MRRWMILFVLSLGACFPPLPAEVDEDSGATDTSAVSDSDQVNDVSPPDTVDATAQDSGEEDDTAATPDTLAGDTVAPPECESEADCGRLSAPPCLLGICDAGKCVTETLSAPCDDGDPCTTEDACTATGCVGRAWTAAEAVGWAALFDGPAAEYATGVAIHPSGDVTVVGSFESTASLAGQARTARGDGTQPDAFIARFGADGTLKWVAQAGGAGLDVALHVVADGEDAVVAGWFQGTATFGSGANEVVLVAQNELGQSFFARFNAAGSLSFVRRIAGYVLALEPIPAGGGDVLIAAAFRDTAMLDGVTQPFTISSAGGLDVYLARIDSEGRARWWGRAGGPSDDGAFFGIPTSLSADAAGQVTALMSFGSESATYRSPGGTFALNLAGPNALGFTQTILTLTPAGSLVNSTPVAQPVGAVSFVTDVLALDTGGRVQASGQMSDLQEGIAELSVERVGTDAPAWHHDLSGDSRYSLISVAAVGSELLVAGTLWGGDLILSVGTPQSPAISADSSDSHLFLARYSLLSGAPLGGVASPDGGVLSATEWRYLDALATEGATMLVRDAFVATAQAVCGTVSEHNTEPGSLVESALPGTDWVGPHAWAPSARFGAAYCVRAARAFGCGITP